MSELNETLSYLALGFGPVSGTVLLRIDFERLLVGGDSVFDRSLVPVSQKDITLNSLASSS